MSMHEIESLVEFSILSLDSWDGRADRRSLFYNLYRLQEQFDTGFTHFRVMDALVRHHFVYTFPYTGHPQYTAHKAYFDQLAEGGKFSFIYEVPGQPWDAKTNPVAGYTFYDHDRQQYLLYCDAGSPLWKSMVDAHILQGDDAQPPHLLTLPQVVLAVATAAAAQQDTALLSQWYTLLPFIVMQQEEDEPLHTDADMQAVLQLILEHNAIDAGNLPPADELPEGGNFGDFCQWWYEPVKHLLPATAPEEAETPLDLDSIPFTTPTEKPLSAYEAEVALLLEEVNQAITELEEKGDDPQEQLRIETKLQQLLDTADKGLALAPDNMSLLVNKGSALMLTQQYEAALALYDKALLKTPEDPFLHLNRAILYFHMEKLGNAATAFRRVLELDPNNAFAIQWLQYIESQS